MSSSEEDTIEKKPDEKSKVFTFILQRRATGYGLMIGTLASFQQMLGNKLSNDYDVGQILLTRYTIQALLCTLLLAITKKPFGLINRKETMYVTAKAFCYSVGILSMYGSFQYILYADSIAIIYGASTVVVIILGRIFLEEFISCCTIILSLMMIIGIFFTSQPSFLFNKLSDNLDPLSMLIGNIFAILAAILYGSSSVLCRKIQLTHSTTLAFYVSLWGIIIGSIKIGFSQSVKMPTEAIDFILFASLGTTSFLNINIWSKGFQAGNVTEVTLAMQVDTPLCYLFQFLVMHVIPNFLSILGAFEISVCIIILTIQDNLFKCYVTTCKKYEPIPGDEIVKCPV